MPSRIMRAAKRLWDAEQAASSCDRLADLVDATSTADGYAVQAEAHSHHQRAGRRAVGYKIGLTAPAAQSLFGASEPMRGRLFADNRLEAETRVALAGLCAPRLEGEIVLKVGTRPDPTMDDDALAATIATAHAAFEIADSRVRDWRVGIGEAIADNACCGRFGLVEPGVPIDPLALPGLTMTIHQEGTEAPLSEGVGANCLGSPLKAYRWLVESLGREGLAPAPGDLVLTGALGPVVAMRPGVRYIVTIERLGVLRLMT